MSILAHCVTLQIANLRANRINIDRNTHFFAMGINPPEKLYSLNHDTRSRNKTTVTDKEMDIDIWYMEGSKFHEENKLIKTRTKTIKQQ